MDTNSEESGIPPVPAYARPYADVFDFLASVFLKGKSPHLSVASDDKKLAIVIQYVPDWVRTLFQSVSINDLWHGVKKSGRIKDENEYRVEWRERWRHRSPYDLDRDIIELELARSDFQIAVGEYLKQPQCWFPYLDWYCAEVLIYATYIECNEALEPVIRGLIAPTLARVGGKAAAFLGYAMRYGWVLLKWAVWLGAVFIVGSAYGQFGLLVALIVTTAWQWRKWRARDKVRKILTAMWTAYDVLHDEIFSWEIVWLELNRARELGVKWPGELYKLVELRKGSSP